MYIQDPLINSFFVLLYFVDMMVTFVDLQFQLYYSKEVRSCDEVSIWTPMHYKLLQ